MLMLVIHVRSHLWIDIENERLIAKMGRPVPYFQFHRAQEVVDVLSDVSLLSTAERASKCCLSTTHFIMSDRLGCGSAQM